MCSAGPLQLHDAIVIVLQPAFSLLVGCTTGMGALQTGGQSGRTANRRSRGPRPRRERKASTQAPLARPTVTQTAQQAWALLAALLLSCFSSFGHLRHAPMKPTQPAAALKTLWRILCSHMHTNVCTAASTTSNATCNWFPAVGSVKHDFLYRNRACHASCVMHHLALNLQY
jgi:hypothetical protein